MAPWTELTISPSKILSSKTSNNLRASITRTTTAPAEPRGGPGKSIGRDSWRRPGPGWSSALEGGEGQVAGGGGGVAAEGPAVGRGPAEAPPEAERRGGVPGGELPCVVLCGSRGHIHLVLRHGQVADACEVKTVDDS